MGAAVQPLAAAANARRVAVIIPAFNEASRVGAVIDVAKRASLVSEVLVVDNASTDGTAVAAAKHGVRVLHESTPGKGQAMRTGVAGTDAPVIVFLDADLTGMRPDHVDSLIRPILDGTADMSLGTFDRGPVKNSMMKLLPKLTGQRGMRRELFESLSPEDVRGWRVEAALNSEAKAQHAKVSSVVLDGMFHHTKEEKYDNPIRGFAAKVKMLGTAMSGYAEYALRRRLRGAPAAGAVDAARGAAQLDG